MSSLPGQNCIPRPVDYQDPEAPSCLLDFRLSSIYNQHKEWNKCCAESVQQHDSFRDLTIRERNVSRDKCKCQADSCLPRPYKKYTNTTIYRNKLDESNSHLLQSLSSQLRNWENPRKDSIHKADNRIPGPHAQETNAGYTRKPNGAHFMN